MYIVSLTYHRPIEEVDSHLEGHVAWLKNISRTVPSSPPVVKIRVPAV